MGGGGFGSGKDLQPLDARYGDDWREATSKTLERELKERGLAAARPRDHAPIGLILLALALLAGCAAWVYVEWGPAAVSHAPITRT